MGYKGYLVKFGDYIIPLSWMKAETYNITKYEQDLDSYTDSDGVTHRFPLEHWVSKCEFETPPLKTNVELSEFWSNLQAQYIDSVEKNAMTEFYISELDDYVVQEAYIPTVTHPIYLADENIIKYNEIRFAIIAK